MQGMGTSLQTDNPTIVSAFHTLLLRQSLFVVAILALIALAWNLLRAAELKRAERGDRAPPTSGVGAEPPARRLLRLGFGALWLFDGILQSQASMPLGLPSGVITPAAASSPRWVQSLVESGVTIWSNHPITAAAATVWIQVGLGLFLLVAPRGRLSRLAGASSAVWGAIVWIFGEAFGGIFGHGSSFLFGSPGAALVYLVAGVLVALPDSSWASARLGRRLLGAFGALYLVMAALQAWPGRGFWQGQSRPGAAAGTLTAMVQGMSATPQPGILASWVRSFASFDAANGFGVNLFVVLVLAGIGLALLLGDRRLLTAVLVVNALFCLSVWVLVQDLGFLGGVGTDPNSMLPLVLAVGAASVALLCPVKAPEPLPAAVELPGYISPAPAGESDRRERLLRRPAYLLRSLAALGTLAITLLGAVPIALASTNPIADPILSEAVDGAPSATDTPLAAFALEDQNRRIVTPASLRGKVVALTFLDPVCTTDCPIIAEEFHEADLLLGRQSSRAEFVAVVANPLYNSLDATRAFDAETGLSAVSNWRYLTGPDSALRPLWDAYGIAVSVEPAGSMVAHADLAFLIDPSGHIREILSSDPGQGSSSMRSSFSGVVASELRSLLAR